MPGSFPVSTCLSPAVYNMVCLVGFEVQNSIEIRSLLNEDNQVCWSQICEQVSYLPSGKELDYVESVRNLGPLCDAVHALFMSLPNEKYEEAFHQWFQWTNNCELFLHALNSLKSLDGTKISLFLMKITSCLERSLGDAYLLIGTDCPFLLRDLLSSKELAKIFSQTVMDVLRIFLGSPQSLNLRNLLWHGFMSPHEISPKFADCAIFLLPQLETGLRLAFCTVNECPNRMLTAQSTSLYTTFDEILAKHLIDGSHNHLPGVLGDPAMEFLWDMLNHQEGPRVRDHLSHGELQLCEFPKQFANELLGFSIVLLHKHLEQDSFAKEDTAVLNPIIDAVESYRSRFHPIALVQKQVLQCCESLQKWELLPIPSLEHPSKSTEPQDNADPSLSFFSEIRKILSLLHLQGKTCCSTEDCSSWLQTHRWFVSITELCRQRISNLYCPRMVLEAVNILQKVSIQCHHVSENIVSTSKLRYEQWQSKTLRSRQRQNYQRLLFSIKSLAPVLRLIVTIVIVDLHNIHSLSEEAHLEYQKYLKHLKCILQYTENMSTCTSPKKNRWDEAIHMTNRIILKITAFNENRVAE
ncbi:endoplasmic reticulum membrane-associated RNA degradation protein isoform X4 [Ranitomeya variabilis]|uniref:endoplasmic reticulum membrane-associated RNA degradation protein isoform X4 n=1 Tax=Ranitomeya variabilis TaxID=490064 RepID=UPI004056BA9B